MSQHPDPAEFRRAVAQYPTGVTVVATRDRPGQVVGMTANSFISVSLSPPVVLISVMQGQTLRVIEDTGRFAVNVLPACARDLSNHFAGKPVPGFAPHFDDVDGSPKVSGSMAYFDCAVDRLMVVNDHTLILGDVNACTHSDAQPLIFFSSQYHDLYLEDRPAANGLPNNDARP